MDSGTKMDGPEESSKADEILQVTTLDEEAQDTILEKDATEEPPFSVFSMREKRLISYSASFAAMFSGLSGFIYYPAMVPLAGDLSVSVQLINLTVTSYIIIAGIAPAFMGDIADQTGRRPVNIMTFVLMIAANVGLALQKSYPALLVLRMLQSAGSSSTYSIAYGVIADIATVGERGSYVGILILFTCTAPSLGPVIGGALADKLGWRAHFWFLVILSGSHFLVLLIFFPETQRKIKTKNNGKDKDGNDGEVTKRPHHIPNPLACIPVLLDRGSLSVIMIGSIYYSISRALGASLAVQSIEIYNLNYLEPGLVYIPSGVAGIFSSYLTDRNYKTAARRYGRGVDLKRGDDISDFPIEKSRLKWVYYLILISTGGTLGYGWSLWARTICGRLLTDLNPQRSATAQAAYNLVRCVGAGAAVATLDAIGNAIGLGWCFTIYGALLLGVIPLVFILETKGMKWRSAKNESPKP
ncbi:hypothetical protein V500_03702 [Pseudogymnoascus sp. VKM F-4518 (FW-2643)]|nr:hypothetical protein V500_03702 [Pseudogymnoascus sp. VKM F-4518 (FW-2643)]